MHLGSVILRLEILLYANISPRLAVQAHAPNGISSKFLACMSEYMAFSNLSQNITPV